MNNNNILVKCPECGESNFKKLDDTTCKCNICGCTFFVASPEINDQLNMALTYREMYKFSRSDEIYQNIIDKTDDEKIQVMCYFGRLLSYFGITYIKDFDGRHTVTYSKYDPDYESIKESSYYKHIIESKFKDLYQEKLDLLDAEYKRIKNELTKTPLYDVFICTKISLRTKHNLDVKGFTEDSQYAFQFYKELKSKGLKVFYSQEVLSGIDFDAQIYSALMRSKNILVITTDKDYLESAWVQSEWRRWINFISTGVKEKNSLYLFIPNGIHLELPIVLEKTQKFNNTLELVNRMEEQISPKKQATPAIDSLLRKANTSIVLGKYDAAEKILTDLCMDYPDDYRPWTYLMDLLSESKVPYGDEKYKRYYEAAMSICTDKSKKDEIKRKYKVYLTKKEEVKEQKNNSNLSTTIKGNNNVVSVNGIIVNNTNNVDNVIKTLDQRTSKKKKKCRVCNADMDEDENICPYCETVQESNPSKSKHSSKTTKNCHGCGMEIDASSRECPYCGYIEYNRNITKSNDVLFDDAYDLYTKKDYQKAFEIFTDLANKGYAKAQYQLGYMYLYNEGVEKDLEKAITWFNKAISNGEKLSYFSLGALYQYEKGTLPDLYKARELYQQAEFNGVSSSEQINEVNKMIHILENQESKEAQKQVVTSLKHDKRVNLLMLGVFIVLQFLLLFLFDRKGIRGHLMIAEPTFLILFAFIYRSIGYYKSSAFTVLENLFTVVIILVYSIWMSEFQIVLIVFLVIVTCIFMAVKQMKYASSIQFALTMVCILIALFSTTHLLPLLYSKGKWHLLWYICVQDLFMSIPLFIWKNKYDVMEENNMALYFILIVAVCIAFIVLHIITICQLGLSVLLIICTILVSIIAFILACGSAIGVADA